ncbi:hypothetical protein RRG08_044769 [Elysia crispata]|uniref:Uncharacterized protein n=1 Tax=Elysia crispata TaxID=231223 RepID=A0AAE1DG91_9GAST|nr:hypothetical protein RRG08_044769 [Elysia crispata]
MEGRAGTLATPSRCGNQSVSRHGALFGGMSSPPLSLSQRLLKHLRSLRAIRATCDRGPFSGERSVDCRDKT